MALAIDSSTPAFVANLTTGETTASFTPPVGSLLVVACTGTPFAGNPAFAVTSTGLTFVQQALSNVAGESTVTLFTAEVGAAGGSSRTVSCTSSGYASSGLKVWVLTGQHASQYFDKVATGVTGATPYNASITTDTDGNWVLGAVSDFADTDSITSSDTFEAIHSVDMSYMVVRKAAATSPAGAETLNIVAARTGSAWAAISIRDTSFVPPAVYKAADRGSTSNITSQSSTTVALASGGSIATGNYLIARVAMDNSGTSGAARTLTVTDTHSNTWTTLTGANRTAGSAANDGSTCYIAYAKVTTGFSNGDNLTFTYSGAVVAKAIVVEEWVGLDATTPIAVSETTATGGSTTPSISRTPLASGQLFYGALSVEGPTGDTYTEDSDTTAGTWSTLSRVSSASGTAASNQTINGVAKLVTGTSAQTWNPTITNRDWAQVALVFAPSAGGGTPNADASLAGTGTLSGTAVNAKSAAGALAGTGTLSGTATSAKSVDASLSGSGSLSASGATSKPVDATVAGIGSLAATAQGSKSVDGSLAGTGSLSGTAANAKPVAAVLAGTGTITAAATTAATQTADAALSGTGTLSSTASTAKPVDASLAGTGSLSSTGSSSKPVDSSLTGTGSLVGAATTSKPAAASLAGTGTLTAAASTSATGSIDATLAGTGTLTASGTSAKPVTSALAGTGTLSPSATREQLPTTALTGTGTLAGTAATAKPVGAVLAATGTLTAAASVAAAGPSMNAVLAGTGSLSATATIPRAVAVALAGSATITAQASVSRTATAILVGVGSFIADADTAGQTTPRPFTGTTIRPGSGRTIRPDTGRTERP